MAKRQSFVFNDPPQVEREGGTFAHQIDPYVKECAHWSVIARELAWWNPSEVRAVSVSGARSIDFRNELLGFG